MHTILVCVAEAWAQKFKSLSRTPKWTGRTPASAQDDHVSIAVLRFLHSSGDDGWGKVDDMWQAKCMPLWGLVRRNAIGFKPCFIVRVYSLLHHLARGGDRPEDLDARHGCGAFGHVVCNGPRRVGGSPDAREVAHLRGGSQGYVQFGCKCFLYVEPGALVTPFCFGLTGVL